MTTEEYKKWEQEAIERGYKKYTTTSSINEYSYFKTIGRNGDRCKYQIEWRIWDFGRFADKDPRCKEQPYSLDVNILPDSIKHDMRLDMLIGDPLKLGFDKVESIAEHYYQFIKSEKI